MPAWATAIKRDKIIMVVRILEKNCEARINASDKLKGILTDVDGIEREALYSGSEVKFILKWHTLVS